MLRVLEEGTYLTALIKPTIRGARRARILAALAAGADPASLAAALDEKGHPLAHLARVIEYEVPDREGHGTGELIVLLSTILGPPGDKGARADELAGAYHQRWEQETGHDQLTVRASVAADLDPDRISFTHALRLIRRTATATAAIPPAEVG